VPAPAQQLGRITAEWLCVPDKNPSKTSFAYSKQDHAVACLRQLNNNPTAFTAERRPIVEFAIDNVKVRACRVAALVRVCACVCVLCVYINVCICVSVRVCFGMRVFSYDHLGASRELCALRALLVQSVCLVFTQTSYRLLVQSVC
jgi:hypothetical protein